MLIIRNGSTLEGLDLAQMISFYAYSTNEPSEGYVHYIIRFQKGCDIIVIKLCGKFYICLWLLEVHRQQAFICKVMLLIHC